MHGPMPKVLPAVAEHNGDAEPSGGIKEPVDQFGHANLPGGETIGQSIAEMRIIDPNQCENPGKGISALADTSSPHGYIVIISAVEVSGIHGPSKEQTQGCLDGLLEEDRAKDLGHGDAVALFEFLRGMKTVLGEVVLLVDEKEDEGHEPVRRYREYEREMEIRQPWQYSWDRLQSVGWENSKVC
ncbi:MAG: hypothetical protein Q9194_003224 [Teloschistes cf. exilis]